MRRIVDRLAKDRRTSRRHKWKSSVAGAVMEVIDSGASGGVREYFRGMACALRRT
jgi:hypothetical protein